MDQELYLKGWLAGAQAELTILPLTAAGCTNDSYQEGFCAGREAAKQARLKAFHLERASARVTVTVIDVPSMRRTGMRKGTQHRVTVIDIPNMNREAARRRASEHRITIINPRRPRSL